jgi:hypothetical protein
MNTCARKTFAATVPSHFKLDKWLARSDIFAKQSLMEVGVKVSFPLDWGALTFLKMCALLSMLPFTSAD